jgi:DNA-binding response OmpR family regulator
MGTDSESKPRVLIVDDEAPLLQLMSRFVGQLGYDVEVTSTGRQAWDVFARDPSSFRLVIADLTLPDMAGQELLRQMLEANPALRILVCSGYPANPGTFGDGAVAGFLQKPFLPRMLEQAVRSLMQRESGPADSTK